MNIYKVFEIFEPIELVFITDNKNIGISFIIWNENLMIDNEIIRLPDSLHHVETYIV